MKTKLIRFSTHNPKLVIVLMLLLTVLTVSFAGVRVLSNPSGIIDTDPENMLDKNEAVRVFHQMTKDKFEIFDFVALGVYHPGKNGVFQPEILRAYNEITNEIMGLQHNNFVLNAAGDTVFADLHFQNEAGQQDHSIIFDDIIALNQVEDINGETGELVIKPLMKDAPETSAGAADLKRRIDLNPLYKNKLASEDGKIVGIFVPIKSKTTSFSLSQIMEALAIKYLGKIQVNGEPFLGTEDAPVGEYVIAGIPVAQDTFGRFMFAQMGVSAPMAGLVIFILLFVFFRKVNIIAAPMLMAIFIITWTMSILVGTGHTVHIMSSMIPIFLFPISVLDSIHIISSIHKSAAHHDTLKAAVTNAMNDLFSPILFTSVTTIVGFVTLYLTFIPPVQVFGIFVGLGVFFAWLMSVTFIPAYLILVGEKAFIAFGNAPDSEHGLLGKISTILKKISQNYGKVALTTAALLFTISLYGISKIEINDNPIKWFKKGHPLRFADELLNSHVAGTYMANVVFDFSNPEFEAANKALSWGAFKDLIEGGTLESVYYAAGEKRIWGMERGGTTFKIDLLATEVDQAQVGSDYRAELTEKGIRIRERRGGNMEESEKYEEFEFSDFRKIANAEHLPVLNYDAKNNLLFGVDKKSGDAFYLPFTEEVVADVLFESAISKIKKMKIALADTEDPFKTPALLEYMARVEKIAVGEADVVGASSSILDILRKVSWELRNRDDDYFRLPQTKNETGQFIFLAKGGESPDDIHKFITRDFRSTQLWLHLNSGDNKDMEAVIARVNEFTENNSPPLGVDINWAGLNYINTVWQEKMVGGMANALMGAFITVFIMVVLLFRSLLWGAIAMVPITLTISLIYSLIGFFGKAYDMPIAVLSSLTLGLSIDFGIHYIERIRHIFKESGSFASAIHTFFGEPATAMLQNTIAISIGFTPLIFSDLKPYQTVGGFFLLIMLISGFSTLVILPAISRLLQRKLFPQPENA